MPLNFGALIPFGLAMRFALSTETATEPGPGGLADQDLAGAVAELAGVKALTFDVFGTVVDWRGSIAREVRAFAAEKKLREDFVVLALWQSVLSRA